MALKCDNAGTLFHSPAAGRRDAPRRDQACASCSRDAFPRTSSVRPKSPSRTASAKKAMLFQDRRDPLPLVHDQFTVHAHLTVAQ